MMDANVEEQATTPATFVEYLERYLVKKPDIPDHSFGAHLMEYFGEGPNFTEWRCCNSQVRSSNA
jgi:hypothetical protein